MMIGFSVVANIRFISQATKSIKEIRNRSKNMLLNGARICRKFMMCY